MKEHDAVEQAVDEEPAGAGKQQGRVGSKRQSASEVSEWSRGSVDGEHDVSGSDRDDAQQHRDVGASAVTVEHTRAVKPSVTGDARHPAHD